ncbi:hypothetical protein PAE2167 [Pyrobaculum aerophilum str. IM2]|uniref:Uncharacterized protein n=2 Tax=Pyrobaculum aerophilum TaxID=13773 RepID=Q8ZVQ7_PYRAE|nr:MULTISPECIES: hypothetical protein [Pyrobaculum]AAL63999.1 hypothetical protein PAE2167 [Pyrobaculum aerophilum str. IM2]HII47232.1 hypothetical protein [Pyrobaculum aerophilum]
MLSALDIKVKRILWGLAAEFAYLAVVGTTIVPPCSLLKRRVSRVVSPEVLSFLAAKLGGDDPEVRLNSMLGMRLSGVPKCEILNGTLPELYELCTALRRWGREPLFKVAREVVIPLAVSASAAGYEEGEVLLTSYRAASGRGARDLDAVVKYFNKWYLIRF